MADKGVILTIWQQKSLYKITLVKILHGITRHDLYDTDDVDDYTTLAQSEDMNELITIAASEVL
jgi:hypothetical protein